MPNLECAGEAMIICMRDDESCGSGVKAIGVKYWVTKWMKQNYTE